LLVPLLCVAALCLPSETRSSLPPLSIFLLSATVLLEHGRSGARRCDILLGAAICTMVLYVIYTSSAHVDFVFLLVEGLSVLVLKLALLRIVGRLTTIRQTFAPAEVMFLSDLFALALTQSVKSVAHVVCGDIEQFSHSDSMLLSALLGVVAISVTECLLFAWWGRLRGAGVFFPLLSGVAFVMSVPSLRLFVVRALFTWKAMCVVLYWSVFLSVSLVLLTHYAPYVTSTTRLRKCFHLLAVVLFLPIVYIAAELLTVACAVVLSLMLLLEYARHVNLFGITPFLDDWLRPFTADVDKGPVIYSPMTLLLGCVLPLFVLGAPSKNNIFSYVLASSGILVLGVTDAMAAVVGSAYGRHRWHSSSVTLGSKSVEGTVAAFLSTFIAAFILILSVRVAIPNPHSGDSVLFWLPSVLLSSLCVALYEALCPIHDNLTLPVYFLATLLFTGPPSLRV